MNFSFSDIPCFGVAGNFTGHLEQAGEARDFTNVKTLDAKAPKGIFPTFIPSKNINGSTPDFLKLYPFSTDTIIFPAGEEKLQIEPECALIFNVQWKDNKIVSLEPVVFGASNDCSIRKEGATKISEKKNWGQKSKGVASNLISVDSFSPQGVINKYRIASFLIRDGKIFDYGEDSAVRDYSYIYSVLTTWMMEKFNGQQNEGPLENLHSYLLDADKPEQIMVSIGATRYTDFGEHNFLLKNDETVVILYPENNWDHDKIKNAVLCDKIQDSAVSVLRQKIIY